MEIEWTIALNPITTEGRYNSVVLEFKKNHECNLNPPFSLIPVPALQLMVQSRSSIKYRLSQIDRLWPSNGRMPRHGPVTRPR
jgi:hypothetical protein